MTAVTVNTEHSDLQNLQLSLPYLTIMLSINSETVWAGVENLCYVRIMENSEV